MTDTTTAPPAEPQGRPTAAVPDTIDRQRFGDVLVHAERLIHRHGWDAGPPGGPQLMVVYEETADDGETDRVMRRACGQNPRCGPAARVDGYACQTWQHAATLHEARQHLAQQDGKEWQIWDVVRHTAMVLAYAPDDHDETNTIRAVLCQPGILGVAFAAEAWSNISSASNAPAFAAAFAAGRVNLADEVGSREARTVYAVDLQRNVYNVTRHRGHPAELDIDANQMRGDFTNSLRIMIDALRGDVPDNPDDFDLRYPSLRDTLAAREYIRTAAASVLRHVRCGDPVRARQLFQRRLDRFEGRPERLAEFRPAVIAEAFAAGEAATISACGNVGVGNPAQVTT